jgi:hypothetical protein
LTAAALDRLVRMTRDQEKGRILCPAKCTTNKEMWAEIEEVGEVCLLVRGPRMHESRSRGGWSSYHRRLRSVPLGRGGCVLQGLALVYIDVLIPAAVDESSRLEGSRESRRRVDRRDGR